MQVGDGFSVSGLIRRNNARKLHSGAENAVFVEHPNPPSRHAVPSILTRGVLYDTSRPGSQYSTIGSKSSPGLVFNVLRTYTPMNNEQNNQ